MFSSGQVVRLRKSRGPYGIIEGEAAEYLASLTELPSNDVLLDIKSVDERSVVNTPQVTFTPDTWNESQKIYIFARDDNVIEDTPYYTEVQFNTSSVNESLIRNVTVPIPIIDADTGKHL